ncbi:XK-related protein 8-like [Haplochromis burtoni]|uniref:XK-related protein 8-like n=1 Tax=Haplochromis burtoni TaxID=8153 RepID=UPI001C2D4A1D|nr:XK-related protein 8-like [Haplochromis burtoni]
MPGSEDEFKCCTQDFLFTCVDLLLFLLDIGVDIWAAVSLYKQEAYVYFSLLLLFLLGSSMLVQVYSWLWYRYDDFKMKTKIEKKPSQCQLKLLHVFQLGIFFGYAGIMGKSVQSLYGKDADAESVAKFLRQDLRILHFIEMFSSGLIWYFNWFSVAKGMRIRSVLYHAYILIDICILCGLWCWKMSTDPPDFVTHPLTTAACVVAVYVLGLLFKVIYYTFFHPNLDKDKLKGATITEEQPEDEERSHSVPTRPLKATDNKRMRKLAENFFC